MNREILLYITTQRINQITNWGIGLIATSLVIRAMHDFMEAMASPETGLKDAFRKTKKRIYAAVIAITAESTILFIQRFY